MNSKFVDFDYEGRPHLLMDGGVWRVLNSYKPFEVVEARNQQARNWAARRNVQLAAKPKRCPVPLDDVCDYGRGITLEDNPGRNPHGPFN